MRDKKDIIYEGDTSKDEMKYVWCGCRGCYEFRKRIEELSKSIAEKDRKIAELEEKQKHIDSIKEKFENIRGARTVTRQDIIDHQAVKIAEQGKEIAKKGECLNRIRILTKRFEDKTSNSSYCMWEIKQMVEKGESK